MLEEQWAYILETMENEFANFLKDQEKFKG